MTQIITAYLSIAHLTTHPSTLCPTPPLCPTTTTPLSHTSQYPIQQTLWHNQNLPIIMKLDVNVEAWVLLGFPNIKTALNGVPNLQTDKSWLGSAYAFLLWHEKILEFKTL